MNDYWQEHKSLLTLAGGGLLAFLIGYFILEGLYGGKVSSAKSTYSLARSNLMRDTRYGMADRDLARAENDALMDAVRDLEALAEFRPRPEFELELTNSTAASSRYIAVQERVREDLAVMAGRRRATLPMGLDLEMLRTSSIDVIERHLHALDLLDRVLRLALDAGVKQVKRIKIDLDPSFESGRGLGPIERTAVEVEILSTPEASTAWLQSTQAKPYGQSLPIRSVDSRVRRAKLDEVTTKVTFEVVRVDLDGLVGEEVN